MRVFICSARVAGSPIRGAHIRTPTSRPIDCKQEFERYIRDTDGFGSLAKQVSGTATRTAPSFRILEYHITIIINMC